jgi:rhodanese-related sulfurtransferase
MILTVNSVDLLKMMNSGSTYKLVDVMELSCYNEEHIKGAISIPIEYFDQLALLKLNVKDSVVVYSKNIHCEKSMIAAQKLDEWGFENVYVYKEGIEDYKHNYLPLEVIFLPDLSADSYA